MGQMVLNLSINIHHASILSAIVADAPIIMLIHLTIVSRIGAAIKMPATDSRRPVILRTAIVTHAQTNTSSTGSPIVGESLFEWLVCHDSTK